MLPEGCGIQCHRNAFLGSGTRGVSVASGRRAPHFLAVRATLSLLTARIPSAQ